MSKQKIMYGHVERWKQSGLTQSEYCASVGIKLATFSYWVTKHKNESFNSSSSSFITISKEQKTEGKDYEIVYPNGVTLRLNRSSLLELSALLKLV